MTVLLGLSPLERRVLDVGLLAAGLAVAVLGVLAGLLPLVVLGALAVAAVVAILAPELMLCALVVVGGVKGAPWFPDTPVDLTFVAWFGTVLAMLFQGLGPGGGLPRFPRGTLLALPLVALVVGSVYWSLGETTGAVKALQFELITMTTLVAPVVLIRTRAALVRLALGFVGFGLLIALTTVKTTNLGEPLAAAGGNQIQAALYPAIAVVFVATYLALVTRGARRIAVLLSLVVLVPGTVAAGSRGVFVAAVVVSVYIVGRAVLVSRRRGLVLLVTGAVVLSAVAFWPYLAGGAADRYQRQLLSTNFGVILGARGDLYERGVSLAAARPFGGVGAGGFAFSSMVYEENQYPHNVLIEFASEEGIFAAALFCALVVAAWRTRLRASFGPKSPEVLVSGAILLFFLSEAMVSFDINRNRGLWFALGLAFAMPGLQRTAAER